MAKCPSLHPLEAAVHPTGMSTHSVSRGRGSRPARPSGGSGSREPRRAARGQPTHELLSVSATSSQPVIKWGTPSGGLTGKCHVSDRFSFLFLYFYKAEWFHVLL